MTKPIDDELAHGLLMRCAKQDEQALGELHALLARRVYAFAFNRLRDPTLAETVVIDTLYEVWKSAAKFRGDSKVSTWVLGICRYKILELRREIGPDHDDIESYSETMPSELENAEERLSRWQEEQAVHRCMTTLSAAHRECMQLVYFEGLSLVEIAHIQNVPENTVKTRLFHARKLMRHCVEAQHSSSKREVP
ncbi:MAG: RNA polymerase sigma factor [Burkholderiales bacterium]